jgi:polyribonucleotide nucleotidyltransferase
VGTKEALTMVEAGANEIPEETILEAFELAHAEIVKLCEAQEDLRRQAGKPKWLDLELVAEIERDHGHTIWERIQELGIRESGQVVEELLAELAGPITMDSTDDDIQRQVQVKSALASLLEKQRSVAVEGPVREQFGDELKALTDAEQDSKALRSAKRQLLFDRIIEEVELPFPVGSASTDPETGEALPAVKDSQTRSYVKKACESIYKDLVRQKIAVEKRRPDGRGAEEIRPIDIEVGVNPRAHGSGLFTRGQTQILSSLTLGTAKEGQRIDDLSLEEERRYMHHYNFPPYSVGETGFMRGPKRRDIGHGALAQRALEAVIPGPEDFPYTIRIVSETLESNGSSSMGSVCGSTLSLMDAGVPLKAPVSGIAMGLVKEGDDYVILTDIQGAEDHLGDMDFKVAGSRNGITALQMDIKITGVTQQIMRDALEQAKRAREFILEKMLDVIPESRSELADNAPRITTIKIDQEKIGMVIGKGGETIRGLESDYEVQIDIEEDGTILIYATEGTKANEAIAAIEALTKEPEVGDTYTGKVVKTTQFGAFVELKKGTDGLLHVSNVGPGRVAHIEDVMGRGDVVDVVVQEVDKARGRIGLKLVAKHENGGLVQPEELIERAKNAPPRPPEEDRPRGDRRGGRGGRGRGPRRDDE